MKLNFFQTIGLADMEKVHSAVIGWMLSENCIAFDKKEKSKLLCQIFGESITTFNTINVRVENHHFDILIVAENEKTGKIYWVIENKVKSSQRERQLDDYVNTLKEIAIGCGKKYCLLSLISETPRCENNVWHCTTYGQLAGYIESILDHANKDAKDYVFICEYYDCIKSLDAALIDFLDNPQLYPNVFNDGSKRKEDKQFESAKGQYAVYIGQNNLETIFQKCYLRTILQQMNIELCNKTTINETHGTALIDYLNYWEDNTHKIESHIQIQNGSFKIFLCNINKTSNKEDFVGNLLPLFKAICEKHDGWKINSPKTKPSLSISLLGKEWYNNPQKDIVVQWKERYKLAMKIQQSIIDKII